jgi:chorismate mutase/prephenate dehydratase
MPAKSNPNDEKKAGLDDLRAAVDELDRQLIELLGERARRVLAIAQNKRQSRLSIFDPAREQEIFARALALNPGPLPEESLRAIYREILSACRLLEKQLTVAYYGPAGTNTHLAALRRFGSGAQFLPEESIADVFLAVEKKQAELGVVPVENSSAGVVPDALDAFSSTRLKICAEVYLEAEHFLLSKAPSLSEVKRLYSHPQALAQCRNWLRANLPHVETVEAASTARAAELAAAEAGAAAIATELAGQLYGLPTLAARIQDQADNWTRFFVVGSADSKPTGRDKTSLVFSVKHEAGALCQALEVFRRHQINLTFIQSHPTRQAPWEYLFFVDLQGHQEDEKTARALAELKGCTLQVRVLGSYPEAE